jgi:hypothetical protein
VKVVTVFVSDRGDRYLPGCIASYAEHVGFSMPHTVIDDAQHALGMAGAVRAGFQWALDQECDYALWIEEDFVFLDRVPLPEMVAILDRAPQLAQVVLKRGPWSPAERAAGGIIEMAPDRYIDRSFGPGCEHVEHGWVGDCGFSLNPCVIPRRVLELGWPDGNEAEMSQQLVDAGLSFAFYGRRQDPPRCEHVGAVRGDGWRL